MDPNHLPHSENPSWFLELAHSLRGIRESKQRVVKVLDVIQAKEPKEIAQFFNAVITESGPTRPFRTLHLDLIRHHVILDRLGYGFLAEVYRSAADAGWEEVKLLLRTHSNSSNELEEMPEGYAVRLDSLTLGERRALSRNSARRDFEFLLFDSEPRVIEELLKNPRVSERDVVRIAARHAAPASVLEEICKSERWMSHYSVRKALVFNPNTPIPLASGLLRHLQKKDLKLFLKVSPIRKALSELVRHRLETMD